MRHRIAWILLTVAAVSPLLQSEPSRAQQPDPKAAQQPGGNPAEDAVGREATRLEGELGKYTDTSPQAAAAMLQLADLYYKHGRVFGLVRVGQRFVAAHPTHPRHKEVMLKLQDGLQAISRTEDLVASCRQFLQRYPKAGECSAVEMRLADTLAQTKQRPQAAAAYQAVWNRHKGQPAGRKYGAEAVRRYIQLDNQNIGRGAALAEEMHDALPKGEFAREAGWLAVNQWRRISQWAKSNVAANKLLRKGLVTQDRLRDLHVMMGENYANLSQHTNAALSYRKALALRGEEQLHYQLLRQLNAAQAKAAELESVAQQYLRQYPEADNRFHGVSYVARAYLREQNKERALSLYARLLALDPRMDNNASVFVRENGKEPEQVADSEKKLREAIAAQLKKDKPRDVYYLRYVLAFEVYRDRMKDVDKARQVARELVSQSPSDDYYALSTVNWLLDSAPDQATFEAEVKRILAARAANLHMVGFGAQLGVWQKNTRRSSNKEVRQRSNYVAAQLKQANQNPIVGAVTQQRFGYSRQEANIRGNLVKPGTLAKLSDKLARRVLESQAYYYRHYASSKQRSQSATLYGQLAKRFPKDYKAAVLYLAAATDYAPKEVGKEAALHMLSFAPEDNNSDIWRRLVGTADANKDVELLKRAYQWILKSQQQFKPNPWYASSIGDVLLKHGLEKEAEQHWKTHVEFDRNQSESRDCAGRLLTRMEKQEVPPAQRIAFIQSLLKQESDFHGRYATWLANQYLKAGDLAAFEKTLAAARRRQDERPFRGWDLDGWATSGWVFDHRNNKEAKDEDKLRVYNAVLSLDWYMGSAVARLARVEAGVVADQPIMQQLLELQQATREAGDDYYQWDRLLPFAQSALGKKEFLTAATLAAGMLANVPNVDDKRKQAAPDIVTQSYSRLGGVGLTIDENSPIAPLLQAALYLRLGDERLAFEAFTANRALFDEHRNEVPVDLTLFACERLIAAGGDENHNYVEDVLRSWLVKFSEATQIENETKARVQLLLGKSYFKASRFDIARSEFNTAVNRYPDTPQAIEAEFGIGETFMAQKVFDQAEAVFDKLARSRDRDVVIRAEFLRGVLAFRRGDRDEARDVFRGVLERVPSAELANQALFSLAEVYGAEERYIDQLALLRTVGRLGRASKRRHVPGQPLSIVVHDSDLGISRGHNKIPVRVRTEPGGDSELIYLTGAGAGKGLFRADLESRLGPAQPNDKVLQVTGRDVIYCDYPKEFKAEFKNFPLSDVNIRIAANARFEVSSSKIEDQEDETFSQRLQREAADEPQDQRVSQRRPDSEIKPGNSVYLRVSDPDRDLSEEADTVTVKLTADSGDEVQVELTETEPHSGVFEAVAETGELPAGALAGDSAIDHNPLMAIDQDPATYWMSKPDGTTPKDLTVDMKDLRSVGRVSIATPDLEQNAPLRGDILGSYDGQFWFRLASHPQVPQAGPVSDTYEQMQLRVYGGNFTRLTNWQQVIDITKNNKPVETTQDLEELTWRITDETDEDAAKQPHAALWHGKFVQPRDGAVRFSVQAVTSGLALNGKLELAVGRGNRTVDVWLPKGVHELTIFAATDAARKGLTATRARSDLNSARVTLGAFLADDFDLTQPAATAEPKPAGPARPPISLAIQQAKLNKKTEKFGIQKVGDGEAIVEWRTDEDEATWEFDVNRPGVYHVMLQYAHNGAGGQLAIDFGKHSFEAPVVNTGSHTRFQMIRAATVLVDSSGRQTLTIRPVKLSNGYLFNLQAVALEPAEEAVVVPRGNVWEARFQPHDIRYVRLLVHEYLGEAVSVNHVEIGGPDSGPLYIPTKADILSLANNDVLEIAAGDVVTVTYTDEFTQNEFGGSQLLTRELTATYNNADVTPIAYDFNRSGGGAVSASRKELLRVDPGERVVVEIVDYDEDRTNQRDTIQFEIAVNDGEPLPLEATETGEFTGVFTKEVDTTGEGEAGKLAVKMGDRIYIRYVDRQNTFPGHSVPREAEVLVNEPSDGRVRVLQSRVTASTNPEAPPQVAISSPPEDQTVSTVALAAPLTVEVIDPDSAKDSRSSVRVKLKTSDGAELEVECVISSAMADVPTGAADNWALRKGRFVGQVIMQLGGGSSPVVVPRTPEMPRGVIGSVVVEDEENGPGGFGQNLVAHVLNVSGKDLIDATYQDERRPDGKPQALTAQGRLVTDGALLITDREYEKPVEQLHVGERLFLMLTDPDQDVSDDRDRVTLQITGKLGEKESVTLEETLAHTGVFTGSFMLKAVDSPTAGNLDAGEAVLESYFGDVLSIRYADPSSASTDLAELLKEVPVVVGTNGLVAAFSKTFNNENLAVETKFRIAESYFELFKSHKNLERQDEQKADLEAGRRVLREVMEDYPDPKYAPRVAYLLGQFSQELQQWDEAIKSYELILRQFPDHSLAPDAQYKLAQCYEEAGDFDEALEAYVTLAATHPKSPLIANVMIRISDYFYKRERYDVSAQVGEKFLERFGGNEHAPKMAFRVGQCYYKSENYGKAGESFDRFAKLFPEDKLGADALFWSGESFRLGRNNREAFRRYNRCRWDHPASEAAKYARGRLALPEMLQEFQNDANSIDDP